MDPGVEVDWRDWQCGLGGRLCRRLPRHHSRGTNPHPRRVWDRSTAGTFVRTGLQPLPAQHSFFHRVTHSEQTQRPRAVLGRPLPDIGTFGSGILL